MLLRPVVRNGKPGLLGNAWGAGVTIATGSATDLVAPGPPPAAPTPVPVAPPAADPIDVRLGRLRRLGDLRAEGVLSEEEFAAEKARILAT